MWTTSAKCAGLQPSLPARSSRTLTWFGHGCTGNRRLSNRERYYGLGMDALVTGGSRIATGNRRLSKHEHYNGLGMDALLSVVCSRNTNVIMVWAWMFWSRRALLLSEVVLCSLPCCLLCSQVGLPVPLHGQLHGVCLHPVSRPTFGLHAKAALRPRGLRVQTHETGTCTKCCVHQYLGSLSKEKCLKVLRLPAKLQV